MTDLEYLESKIREERAECEKIRAKEQNAEIAQKLRAIFESLEDEGFTEEQAFEIFKLMLKPACDRA